MTEVERGEKVTEVAEVEKVAEVQRGDPIDIPCSEGAPEDLIEVPPL